MQQSIKKGSFDAFANHLEPACKAVHSISHRALIRGKISLIERRGVMNHHLEVANYMLTILLKEIMIFQEKLVSELGISDPQPPTAWLGHEALPASVARLSSH